MDKIFTPNRYFVGFCAVLIVAVFAANFTRDQRILEQAKLIGRQEAEWTWPSQGVAANVGEIKAKILKQSENDATVEVQGEQKISMMPPAAIEQINNEQSNRDQKDSSKKDGPVAGTDSKAGASAGSNGAGANLNSTASTSSSDFKAVLTLYKNGNSRIWLLGKVEGQ